MTSSPFDAFEMAMDALEHAQKRWREGLQHPAMDDEHRETLETLERNHALQRAQLRAIYSLTTEAEAA